MQGPRPGGRSARARGGATLISDALPRVLDDRLDRAAREALLRGAAHGRRGARALRPRARARDGAGDRRPLRPAARRAERDLPAARAPLQRASSCPGGAARRPRGRAAREELARSRASRRWRPRRAGGGPAGARRDGGRPRRARGPIRARRRPTDVLALLRRSSSDSESVTSPDVAPRVARPTIGTWREGRTSPAGPAAGAPPTGRRRRSAGSRSPSRRVVLGSAVGAVKLTDAEYASGQAARRRAMLQQAGFKTPATESVLVQSDATDRRAAASNRRRRARRRGALGAAAT